MTITNVNKLQYIYQCFLRCLLQDYGDYWGIRSGKGLEKYFQMALSLFTKESPNSFLKCRVPIYLNKVLMIYEYQILTPNKNETLELLYTDKIYHTYKSNFNIVLTGQ